MIEQSLAKPLTDVVSQDGERLIEESLQGQELAYQTLLKLAISTTTDSDWTDFGGKPFLAGSGSKKIALRFNISLKFDRNSSNEPAFQREEFVKDDGSKLWVYTVSGRTELANGRVYEEIGTASTDDPFLGYENEVDEAGKWVKDAYGKTQKVAVPLHEALQDAKKKCVTNFQGRAIQGILGLGGLTWEDLEKYNISPVGKSKVAFKKASKPIDETLPSQPPPKPLPGKNAPAWIWKKNNDQQVICVRKGNHFGDDFLTMHKFKEGNTKGVFLHDFSAELWKAIEDVVAYSQAPATPEDAGGL